MFGFKVIFPKLPKFNGRRRSTEEAINASSNMGFNFTIRSLISTTTNDSINFTVSYLVNSCGLLEQRAISLSKRLELKTSSNPDSVLTLLRNHGFTNTQISKCVLRYPTILLANFNKTLKPKFDFFHSIGLCGSELADLLSKGPTVLSRSLENHIIPSIGYLKTVVHSDTNLFKMLKRNIRVLNCDLQERLAPKIALLQAHGVPNSNILSLLTTQPSVLLLPTVNRFHEIVKQVREMGFDPSKVLFVYAIHALTSMNKFVWEGKLDVYRRCGWSEEDIRMAFMKQPKSMMTSEKKIMHLMDVLVNKMGYDPSLIAEYPILLNFSLEKRIIPRCSVLQMLTMKGLVNKNLSIAYALRKPDEYFLNRFVIKFENEVPELLNVYLGKQRIQLKKT